MSPQVMLCTARVVARDRTGQHRGRRGGAESFTNKVTSIVLVAKRNPHRGTGEFDQGSTGKSETGWVVQKSWLDDNLPSEEGI